MLILTWALMRMKIWMTWSQRLTTMQLTRQHAVSVPTCHQEHPVGWGPATQQLAIFLKNSWRMILMRSTSMTKMRNYHQDYMSLKDLPLQDENF